MGFYNPSSEKWTGVDTNLVVLSILWTLHCVIILPVTLMFFLRRHKEPIASRLPGSAILFNFSGIVIMFAIVANRVLPDQYPCTSAQFQPYMLGALLGLPYMLRAWVLWFRFQLTQEIRDETLNALGNTNAGMVSENRDLLKRQIRGSLKLSRRTRFSRHTYMIRWPFLTVVYFWLALLWIFLPLAAIGKGWVYEYESVPAREASARCELMAPGYMGIYALFVLLFILMARAMRGKDDFFYIKKELQYSAAITGPFFVLWAAVNFYESVMPYPIGTLLLLLFVPALSLLGTLYPLRLSYSFEKAAEEYHQLEHVPKVMNDFFAVIASPMGFQFFKEFLEGEFAVENLLFFQAVEDFRETAMLTLTYHHFGDTTAFRFEDSKMEGWLSHKIKGIPVWGRRYCVLRQGALHFYRKQQDQEPINTLALTLEGGVVVSEEKKDVRRPHQLVLVPLRSRERRECLAMANEMAAKKWKACIEETVAEAGLDKQHMSAEDQELLRQIEENINNLYCAWCGGPEPPYSCEGCRQVDYCSVYCQSKHWKLDHKVKCRRLVDIGARNSNGRNPDFEQSAKRPASYDNEEKNPSDWEQLLEGTSAPGTRSSSAPVTPSPVTPSPRALKLHVELDELSAPNSDAPIDSAMDTSTDPGRPTPVTSERRVPRAKLELQPAPERLESRSNSIAPESQVSRTTQINPAFYNRLGTKIGEPIQTEKWQVELLGYALEIYNFYVQPNAFAEVNIDDKKRQQMMSIFGEEGGPLDDLHSPFSMQKLAEDPNVTLERAEAIWNKRKIDLDTLPNVFNACQKEVMTLMHNDPFPRFVRSPIWARLQAKKKEVLAEKVAIDIAHASTK